MPLHTRTLIAVAALLAVLAGVVAPTATPASTATQCTPAAGWGKNRPDLAAQVVTLVNSYRASKGLRPLGVSASLTASSSWKSLHMAGNGYFAHDDPPPVSRSAYQRAKDCGFNGDAWAENIAWGYTSARSVVDGWLRSAGHRANMDNPSFTSTGVGVASSSDGRIFWSQSFGRGGSGVAPAPAGARAASAIGGTPARVGTSTGARLVASVMFVRLQSGRPLTSGEVRCRAEVDGRRLRVLANAFAGAAARCAWSIPGWAKGKQLTGVVGVKVGNAAATRLFMHKLS